MPRRTRKQHLASLRNIKKAQAARRGAGRSGSRAQLVARRRNIKKAQAARRGGYGPSYVVPKIVTVRARRVRRVRRPRQAHLIMGGSVASVFQKGHQILQAIKPISTGIALAKKLGIDGKINKILDKNVVTRGIKKVGEFLKNTLGYGRRIRRITGVHRVPVVHRGRVIRRVLV